MKSHQDVSDALRSALKARGETQASLSEAAGTTQRTLTNVLSGQQDYKLSTLFALADRLGLELVLLPKEAVAGLAEAATIPAAVQTRVQAAQERLNNADRADDGR